MCDGPSTKEAIVGCVRNPFAHVMRTARAVAAVERLFHKYHRSYPQPIAADALRGEHRVVAGLGGLHPHLPFGVDDLPDSAAPLVEELSLVDEHIPHLVLHRQHLGVDELVHSSDSALHQIANVFRDADVGCSHGETSSAPFAAVLSQYTADAAEAPLK